MASQPFDAVVVGSGASGGGVAKQLTEAGLRVAVMEAGRKLEAAGVEVVKRRADISMPGRTVHEVGTARMGRDPKASVLNPCQQAHDVPNLFVMDGSGYVSSACQNPTLTFMALAARSSEYLVDEYRAGRL